jgi:hypothetical protein
MAKEKPRYEVIEGSREMLEKLISLNDDRFGHIDPKIIGVVAIVNKEPSFPYKIIKINNPVAMFCHLRYIFVFFESVWESMNEDQRGLIMLDMLFSLDPDEDEPKLIAPDVKDHSAMLRTFGVDYLDNPGIRDVLTKPIDWK